MGSFFMAILRSVLEMNCGEIMLQCINVYINLKFIIAHQHSFLFKLMDMICYKSLSLFTQKLKTRLHKFIYVCKLFKYVIATLSLHLLDKTFWMLGYFEFKCCIAKYFQQGWTLFSLYMLAVRQISIHVLFLLRNQIIKKISDSYIFLFQVENYSILSLTPFHSARK